jgi:hypothetical protein
VTWGAHLAIQMEGKSDSAHARGNIVAALSVDVV